MLTWTEAYQKAQTIANDTSTATLTLLKSDINTGSHRFNAALNRYFSRRSKTTDITDAQQYYQLPPDCIKPIGVVVSLSNGNKYPLAQVRNEEDWRAMNTTNQSSNWASHFFVRGNDVVGVWPIPSEDISDGLEVYFEARDKELSVEDYTTGTVTVTAGSTTLTHSATGFTAAMVGRAFKVTDGSDGYWYKVGGYTNTSVLTLEEPFIGVSGSVTFKIGQTFLFPDEYHDAPVDYALSRFFEMRNNPQRAAYHLKRYDNAVGDAKAKYASSSASMVITDTVERFNTWLAPPDPITT
jgi:hypothetical protein